MRWTSPIASAAPAIPTARAIARTAAPRIPAINIATLGGICTVLAFSQPASATNETRIVANPNGVICGVRAYTRSIFSRVSRSLESIPAHWHFRAHTAPAPANVSDGLQMEHEIHDALSSLARADAD